MTDLERKLVALAAVSRADCPAHSDALDHDCTRLTIVIRGPIWEVVVGDYSGDGRSLDEAVNEAVETLERVTKRRCYSLAEAAKALQSIRMGVEADE